MRSGQLERNEGHEGHSPDLALDMVSGPRVVKLEVEYSY